MSRPGTNTAYLDYVTPTGIAVLTLDHFPVNSLSAQVVNALAKSIANIRANIRAATSNPSETIRAVVLCGAGARAFCAGADISGFDDSSAEKHSNATLPEVIHALEALPVPTVAAIQGFALGGGFELALGCHFRVMSSTAKLGLPEVAIGLLPGAEGTQRLPRIMGADNALALILSGEHVTAKRALGWRCVDHIVPANGENASKGGGRAAVAQSLLLAAIAFAEKKADARIPPARLPRVSAQPAPSAGACDFENWRTRMSRKRPGEPAPQAIIRCVEAACAGPAFADGVTVEQREFKRLVPSPESKALRHMFFAERAAARVPGIDPRRVKPKPIRTVGVVGAGLMGGGIAMCCANAGMKCHLLDVDQAGLDRGMQLVRNNYERSRSLSSAQKAAALANIHPTTSYADFAECDLVVEAVFENMHVKKQIFSRLNTVCRSDCFLCSNTSALDIDEIADVVTNDPTRVMGTHFFSPANVMKLLENVRAARTSDLTVASMMAWGKKIGKWVILVGNCQGFVGNRMVALYGTQARVMLLEGAYPSEVDRAATRFGMRVGPLQMSDIVGLELGMPRGGARAAALKAGTFNPKRNLQEALVVAGRKGQRFGTGGYFDYDGKSRVPKPSPQVRKMLEEVRQNWRDDPRYVAPRDDFSEEEIVDRLMMPLVNEGFKILEEGFARRPADIDVCYVHGYSFPRRKGGPMHWADQLGLARVKSTLEQIGLRPSKLLLACVESGCTLDAYWKKHGAAILERAGPPKRRPKGSPKGSVVGGRSRL